MLTQFTQPTILKQIGRFLVFASTSHRNLNICWLACAIETKELKMSSNSVIDTEGAEGHYL